ncbi:hypothetical protein Tco_1029706 [Tanacetum coccineum]|uniref:Uncharacterized protein n=1 Tax=Tanacetum coccineum TaxID=301880 RepID=A0ABQ5G4I1_9ASTR
MKILSIGGRLMCHSESLRSKFFNGHESLGKKASWVQWKKALAPKDNSGLEGNLGMPFRLLLWDDVWSEGKLRIVSLSVCFENSKLQITVGQKLAHPSLYHSFRRHPRGGLELTQVEELAKVINPVVLTQSPDSWSWSH